MVLQRNKVREKGVREWSPKKTIEEVSVFSKIWNGSEFINYHNTEEHGEEPLHVQLHTGMVKAVILQERRWGKSTEEEQRPLRYNNAEEKETTPLRTFCE